MSVTIRECQGSEGSDGHLMSHSTTSSSSGLHSSSPAIAAVTPRVPRRDSGDAVRRHAPQLPIVCDRGLSCFRPLLLDSGGSLPCYLGTPAPRDPAPGLLFLCCPVGAGGNGSHSCVSEPSADSEHVLDLCGQGTCQAGWRPRALMGSWQAPGLYEAPCGLFVLCDSDNRQHSQTPRQGSGLVKGPGLLTLRPLSSGSYKGRAAPGVPTHIRRPPPPSVSCLGRVGRRAVDRQAGTAQTAG